MHCNTRLLRSRDNWRAKAKDRNKETRRLHKQLDRRDFQLEKLRQVNADLRQELAARNAQIVADANPAIDIGDTAVVRALCVLLVVVAVVSFRSVPRILKLISHAGVAQIPWIPSFTSVINWTLRVGLAKLNSVTRIADPWLAIIDFSIDVGIKKVLVVLRVRLDALAEKGSALGLEDCECLAVEVADHWRGADVARSLTKIFKQAGFPKAVIKDSGSDLNLGLKIWRKTAKAMSVWIIDDVGHVMANAIKSSFGNRKMFKDFLNAVKAAGAKIRQSDLSFLAPPKVRTKGRFQSIMTLGDWGARMLDLLGGTGRQPDGSIAARIRGYMPHFGAFRSFLQDFSTTGVIASKILKVLKNKGVNQKTYLEVQSLILQLPPRSKVRKKMTAWLDKHLHIQCRLGIGQMPLSVSSDVIESLLGKFKVVLQRNPKSEFNRIVLTIPALCGKISEHEIKNKLAIVSHTDLLRWEQKNVASSHLKQRRSFLQTQVQKLSAS